MIGEKTNIWCAEVAETSASGDSPENFMNNSPKLPSHLPYPPSKKNNYNILQFLLTNLKFIGEPDNSTTTTSSRPIKPLSNESLEGNST